MKKERRKRKADREWARGKRDADVCVQMEERRSERRIGENTTETKSDQ